MAKEVRQVGPSRAAGCGEGRASPGVDEGKVREVIAATLTPPEGATHRSARRGVAGREVRDYAHGFDDCSGGSTRG